MRLWGSNGDFRYYWQLVERLENDGKLNWSGCDCGKYWNTREHCDSSFSPMNGRCVNLLVAISVTELLVRIIFQWPMHYRFTGNSAVEWNFLHAEQRNFTTCVFWWLVRASRRKQMYLTLLREGGREEQLNGVKRCKHVFESYEVFVAIEEATLLQW